MLFNDKERTTTYQTSPPWTHQPVIYRKETAPYMDNGQDYTNSQERQNASSHLNTSGVFQCYGTIGAIQS